MEPEKRKEPAEASPPRRSPLLSLRCQRGEVEHPRKKSPIGRTEKHPDQSVDRDCLYGVPGDYVHPCLCLGKNHGVLRVETMTEEQRTSCAGGLTRLGAPHTPEAVERLGLYCRRLLEKNQVMNLTAITDPADVMTLHFLDSAALLPTRALGGRKLIDVGTGAGFPAWSCGFWTPHHPSDPAGQPGETGGVAHRALPGTGPAGCGAAEGPGRGTVPAKDPSGKQYDVAVSRALAAMPMLAERACPYVKPGGLFLAMKSNKTDEEIAGAEKIIQALGEKSPFVMDYPGPRDRGLSPGGHSL